ncbi:NAD+ synthase [Paenibacillus sophorae]|uniref:NH(3)-dependent NAD(+) synthetase n=1 Tax=Paenibacillus sophorae TaxID=1333845 RepID=A0A1H8S8V4_9BACL|nr:NAD(+) synthase [Paenibacillus sophorae]QWU16825.1 NAD(+) synthase [Paenibacillus sophorae]SEO75160.1 NAD+ synthase [Paenibacillus sophorae]
MSIQEEIIAALGVKPAIDAEAEVRQRADFLKAYILESGIKGLLIAISGGVESAVAAGLCKRATDELSAEQGKEYITLGVFQPYGEQEDFGHSYEAAKASGLKHTVETNIGDAVDEIALETEYALKAIGQHRHMTHQGKGDIKAGTRMVFQHALALENNLLVVGTGHASEAITGSCTTWEGGAADIEPLRSLNHRQVRELASYLGVPAEIITEAKAADQRAGQTDAAKRGITYEDSSDYLEGKPVEPAAAELLESFYRKGAYKRSAIPGI